MGINRNKVLASARKHVHKGSWAKAIGQYQRLVDDDPSDARSMLKIADLHSKLGQTERALEGYHKVAAYYANDEIYEKAAAVYKQALRLAPESPDLHRDLGDAYHRLGRLKDAIRAYHKAQKIHKSRGDGARQSEILERMIALDSQDIGMRIQLAERYAKDGEDARALELFEFVADHLDQEGRVDEFVQVAERIIFLRDEAPDLRRRVIDIYLNRGQYRRALSHLQVCFKRQPQNLQILDLLARAFVHLSREDKAVMVLHEMANQYDARSDDDASARTYERILAIAPNDGRAQSRLNKLRKLNDSGALSPSPHTGALKPRTQTPSSSPPVASSDHDALAGIEFLDETSGVKVQQPQSSQPPTPEQRPPQPQTPPPSPPNPSAPSVPEDEEPVDITDSLQAVEVVAPTVENDADAEADAVSRVLKETDVFIKYGLFDKAYETIVGVIARHPNSLRARSQMARLQQARNNPEGAADEFLEMARITHATPGRSEKFVREAFALSSDSGRIRSQAEMLGIQLDSEGAAHAFASPSPGVAQDSSLAEPTSINRDSTSQPEMVSQLDEPDFPTDEFDDAEQNYRQPDTSHTDRIEVTDDLLAMNLGDLEMADPPTSTIDEPGTQELDLDDDDLIFADELTQPTEDAELGEISDSEFDFDEQDFVDAEFIDIDLEPQDPLESEHHRQDLELSEIDDIPEQEFDELDFDESVFDDADLVEMDVDINGLDELGNAQMGALQDDPAANAQHAPDFALSDEEADQMFDGLFGDSDANEHGGLNGALDEKTSVGERAEVDFLVQQGMAEGSDNRPPINPTLERSTGPGGSEEPELQVSSHDFGARSLSKKFVPAAEFEQSTTLGLGESDAHNTSLELGLAYKDMGLYDEAIFEFNQALDDPDAMAAANFHIALCEIETGKQEAAIKRLETLLQQGNVPDPIREATQEQLQGLEA